MGLTQALSTAMAGLQANQANLALVSGNVANADTPGYTRKTADQVVVSAGGTIGVRIADVQRELDQYIQSQLRTENAGASYADTRAQMFQQLQDVYGQPGGADALETVYNNFTSALQALSTSPDDPSAQRAVVSSAQLLAQQLNQSTASIQNLRESAELGIANAVSQANNALSQIAALNQQIAAAPAGASETANLMDQRDTYVDQLSQLMDIKVIPNGANQISVFTNSGVQLVGAKAAQLSFNAQGTMTATSKWSSNPSQSTVGTITLTTTSGSSIDLLQSNAIRSGTIAAYVQMRDQDLVQAQSQLDALAAGMASALSDKVTAGSAVPNGFQVDVGSLLAGNKVTVNYTDAANAQHTITFIRVDDPSALPLSNDATADPNDTVVGLDFSGGIGSVVTQINSAFGANGLTASNPGGTTLQVVDNGGATATLNSLTTTTTTTSLAGGSAELPLFTDGSNPYTGAITAVGPESVGLAGRIVVNAGVVADPSTLVSYQAGTPAGDSTRPDFIYQQLTGTSLTFSPNTGIGSAASPFSGSISTFLQQAISQQAEAASSANNLKQGQDVVLSSLQQRFNDTSGVDIDQEMADLLTLQNAYAANAHVLTTVNAMFTTLMNM
ncbi:MAG TPA: flagellar hook-associated protein FlgK [Pseudolabrys sp.]|nr:flagellar hook-associated protein FlgK [Pseudolabrys sp.]